MTTSTIEEVPYEKVFNGMVKRLKDGEELNVVESKTPSSVFPTYSELLIRMIGVAVSLPYEFLFLDFSKGSYSSSRAGLIQAYRTFRAEQQWLTSRKMQRLWNWRIAKAVKAGEISRPPVVNGVSEWYKVEWSYPEFAWVDPQSEAQSKMLEYNMGATTLTDICQQKGKDYDDQLEIKADEIRKASIKAQELNKELGTNLTYVDFISTNIPGAKATVQPAVDGGKNNAKGE
jgi:capsid protein